MDHWKLAFNLTGSSAAEQSTKEWCFFLPLENLWRRSSLEWTLMSVVNVAHLFSKTKLPWTNPTWWHNWTFFYLPLDSTFTQACREVDWIFSLDTLTFWPKRTWDYLDLYTVDTYPGQIMNTSLEWFTIWPSLGQYKGSFIKDTTPRTLELNVAHPHGRH